VDAARDAALVRLPALRVRPPIEEISRLVGHSGTHVTELVYRKQLRPVIQTGATAMNDLFNHDGKAGATGA